MNPFQIYIVKSFPSLKRPLVNHQQLTLLPGVPNEAKTRISIVMPKFSHGFDKIKIEHDMKVEMFGTTTIQEKSDIREVTFTSFKRSVQFDAYYHPKEGIILFNAPKDVCKSTFEAIAALFPSLKIEEVEFDFAKAAPLITEYYGVWIKGISSTLRSAGLMGNHVETDENFKKFKKVGEISNVTFPFEHSGASHKVMLTKKSAIVLIQKYDNIDYEIELLLDVYKNLIKRVWATD